MTLLFFDGFTDYPTMQKPEWDTAQVFVAAPSGRTGAGVALNNTQSKVLTLPTPAATCYAGFAFYISSTAWFNAGAVLQWRNGATPIGSVTFDASGHFQLRDSNNLGTVLATSSTVMPVGAWVHLQSKMVAHTTSGTFQLQMNGVDVINLSGVKTSSQSVSITALSFQGGSSNATTGTFDDMWVCDGVDATASQGRPNNDFLGDLKVATVLPTGAGASTQWTPSTGANYAAVDESPPNTSDYVSSAVVGNRDLYDMADLPANSATVYAIRAGLYASKSDAGAATVKPLIREASGAVNVQAAQALATTYLPVYGALLGKKSDGTTWTPADVNGIQAGVEAST